MDILSIGFEVFTSIFFCGLFRFRFAMIDHLVFSSGGIPTPVNVSENEKIRKDKNENPCIGKGYRIFTFHCKNPPLPEKESYRNIFTKFFGHILL